MMCLILDKIHREAAAHRIANLTITKLELLNVVTLLGFSELTHVQFEGG